MTQRWRERRDSYRPSGEPIQTRDYEVAPLHDDATAKAFVQRHHYSGTYPAARFRFGLYRHGDLVGVSVFSHPCNDKVLTNVFPGEPKDSVELGRFVLLDDVPANGETWFLGQCFRWLRQEALRGVVSFSDPVPRTRQDGSRVFPGHIGTIYQAHNGAYLGRGTPRTLLVLPNGLVFSDRAAQKIRSGSRGWAYACRQLEDAGADRCQTDDRAGWLRTWLSRLARPLQHPGNHRYAWALTRRATISIPALPYPKLEAA